VSVFDSYFGVWMSADDEADRAGSTFTQDSIGFTQRSMSQAHRIHLQKLVSSTDTQIHTLSIIIKDWKKKNVFKRSNISPKQYFP